MYQEFTYNCQIITPMFLAGAVGRTPELRSPSFKGVLRYWWRAVQVAPDWKLLLEKEEKIFGGTGKENCQSKIFLRIEAEKLRGENYYPLLPHKHSSPRPPVIPIGKSFRLKLHSDPALGNLPNALFRVVTVLGGFGKRSRRGFGSIEIDKQQFTSREDCLSFLVDTLNKINNIFALQKDKITSQKEGGNYPWVKEIGLGKNGFGDPDQLLKKIGQLTSKYAKANIGSAAPRFSSPLYISIVRVRGKYFPIYTILNAVPPEKLNIKMNELANFVKDL